ncbi:MAG: hypothetical protein ABMB14_35810 [Myxococcota bacterium]
MIASGVIAVWFAACSTPTPEPAPVPAPVAPVRVAKPVEVAPVVAFRLPTRVGTTPAPVALDPQLLRARSVLAQVVVDHARDPENPWAIVHGMLALGPTMKLTNDADPVDWMFEHYAQTVKLGDTELVTFPTRQGSALVEPHTDLILKAMTETGFTPDRAVTVAGTHKTLGDLYRYSLWRAWAMGPTTGFQEGSYNDTPWALQGLAAWAPDGLAWVASGGRKMSMTGFTTAVVDTLQLETAEMVAAMDAGQLVQKDSRKWLFRYTCGGQHLLQGAAYAVGRGFGTPNDRERVCQQLDLLVWRIDVELGAIDPILGQPGTSPAISTVLLSQRLKFLGHWLETTHKIGALGVCPLTERHTEATTRVATELVRTVDALGALGIWADVGAVQANKELEPLRQNGARQVYLDLVGDAAHAVHGIDLATGTATIPY